MINLIFGKQVTFRSMKRVVSYFIFIVWLTGSKTVSCQESKLSVVKEKFDQFRSSVLVEKIFVHIDRSCYLAGETLWFKLYCVDGSFHKPMELSKVAYVEVLNEENAPVLQAKIPLLEDGVGSGSFILPDTIKSGNYVFRAYTNWMKNFSSDFFFEEQLSVINPFISLGESVALDNRYDIQFFPEGGDMVFGLESKIAFRAVDTRGKGIDLNGIIINEKNDTLQVFKTLKHGIGNFLFTPLKDGKYRAIVQDPNKNILVLELPTPLDSGYVLRVDEEFGSGIKVTVSGNKKDSNEVIHLFAHTRQQINVMKSTNIHDGKATFLIEKDLLSEGIVHITIFNERVQPVCERLYFNEVRDVLQIKIRSNGERYGTRSKVTLDLTTLSNKSGPIITNMSAAVFRVDSLKQVDHKSILAYLMLTSDLVGVVESPEYYLTIDDDPIKKLAMDNLMLTHGWRRFLWDKVLDNDRPDFKYIPEIAEHIINGKMSYSKSDNHLDGKNLYIASNGVEPRLNISNVKGEGNFLYQTKTYGSSGFYFQTKSEDGDFHIDILNPYFDVTKHKFSKLNIPTNMKREILRRSIHMQVLNAFPQKDGDDSHLDIEHEDQPFFGKPDKRYMLDDYVRFPTMEEVFREYVKEVSVRREKGDFRLMVLNSSTNAFFRENPLVTLDGVPIFDINKVLELDPEKIMKLEIVTHKYFYGGQSFDGVLNCATYEGDLAGIDPKILGVYLKYEGLQVQKEFFSPVFDGERQAPDARNLLYWNPLIKTNSAGKNLIEFYTSDIIGKYKVVLQGLSNDGKAGSAFFTFDVIKN